ncbi:helix-turn-helix transcriptional regulator [Saccharomonospora cyanea]|uniref:Helix-turn-helix protein n=1 Tax=Saccharomonospora cyanea NA-134 TaxID=882082 RepID=H5XMK8_9PSEU|nr:helix-turn-helix transcriptional regulator [Saccharomonospora cyanea]EHR60987.1 Helix-turn-helix protein [Saccharomonospora cyanea NA-134]
MQRELGILLRRWRERVEPASVGLPAGARRRASGLRREEVALLSGISVDYVVKLEQGRATSASAPVLTALARTLRLSEPERDHLFRLAGQAPPTAGRLVTEVPDAVRGLTDRLGDVPVAVHDAAWHLIACNDAFVALTGETPSAARRQSNALWRHFTGDTGRVVTTPEQAAAFERAAVADLRSASGRYPRDEEVRALVRDLREVSPRFARLWDSHAVGAHTRHTKTVAHPRLGLFTLHCDVLTEYEGHLRVVLYTAERGSDTERRLRLLTGSAATDPLG